MTPTQGGYTRVEFLIPARGLIGYRAQLMTETKGTAIINHVFDSFRPSRGEIASRTRGSLIAHEAGDSVAYGLFNAQDRGTMFIGAGVPVYEGMIVGESSRMEDIVVNVCKRKHATNTRSAAADEALRLVPPREMSLEQCLDFIADDELVEISACAK